MSRTKKIEVPTSGRAGMSLVRAERLVARTQAKGTRSSQGLVALGLAAVAGMIAYGVLDKSGKTGSQDVMMLAASEAATLPATAPATQDLTEAAKPVAAVGGTEALPAALPATDAVAATEVAAAEPVPECIGKIENMLVDLRSESASEGTWETRKAGLTTLVQTTLDCKGAGFRVAGSLELLGSGIADLKVHWDREGRVLDLAMIDRSETAPSVEASATDGSSIEFVIR